MRRNDEDRTHSYATGFIPSEPHRPSTAPRHITLPPIRDIPGIPQGQVRQVGTDVAHVTSCVASLLVLFYQLMSLLLATTSHHTQRSVSEYNSIPRGRVGYVYIVGI